MSGKYVSQKPERKLNDRVIFVERGKRVEQEAFAKSSALRNLPEQSKQSYKGFE